jgi:1-acyl-sn-glycerol-3-phosphate acyltransferase
MAFPAPKPEQRLYHLLRGVVGLVLRRFIKIEVLGLQNLPQEGAAVLVCNHRSDSDPAVVGTAIPHYISWVAADYMRHVPITSWLIQKTGMVLMAVDGQVTPSSFKQARRVLQNGDWLGIFPEGEAYIFTNDFSAPLAEFQPGFAVLAAQARVPIIPVVIRPRQETLKPIRMPPQIRPYIAQLHDLSTIQQIPQYQSVQVVIGEPIRPDWDRFNQRQEAVAWLMQETRQVMLAL